MINRWLAEIGPQPADSLACYLQDRYRRHGFYDAIVVVGRTGGEGAAGALCITEGAPVTFGEVSARLPDGFADEFIRPLVRSSFSGVASMENIEHGVSEIVAQLEDAGYTQAEVSPFGFRRIGNQLSFSLDVAPGVAARVGGWSISGLQRTDTAHVRRLLGLQPGIAWNRAAAMRIEEQIRQHEYLSLAGEFRVSFHDRDSLAVVEIPLAERPAVVTDGGLGIAGGGGGGQSLRGRLNLAVENPFGDGRRLELLIARPSGNLAESRLRIADPHVAWSRIGVQLDLEQFRQGRTYDRVSLAAQGSADLGHRCGMRLLFAWSKITPLAEADNARPARSYDITLSAQQNPMLDFRRMGKSQTTWELGAAASFRREYSSAADPREEVKSRARVHLGVKQAWPVARWIQLRLAGRAESWLGSDAQLGWGDEMYLGGPETVRGFPERSLAARGFGILNTEVGYCSKGQTRVFLFSDFAFYRVFALGGAESSLQRAIGYGIGFELSSHVWRTRLEVGWPEHRRLGDGIMYLRWLRGW